MASKVRKKSGYKTKSIPAGRLTEKQRKQLYWAGQEAEQRERKAEFRPIQIPRPVTRDRDQVEAKP